MSHGFHAKPAVAPLPVVVVGAGAMGGDWIRMLIDSPHAELVGLVDLDVDLARDSLRRNGLDGVLFGSSVVDIAERTGAHAVINVTVPQAHRTVNEQALRAGLPVLCEKPLAPTVAEALRQVALANVTGGLLMVSQSRRYNPYLTAFRDSVSDLGALSTVTAQFFHEDHEPGFREQMAHPLLLDMAIHHFDMLRYATHDEPISVRCSSWNPPWSWFAGDASATAEFELASGARFVYSGSRCTPGIPTSFNADWRTYAEHGAAGWDGETTVTLDAALPTPTVPDRLAGIAGSLEDFVTCLRGQRTPQNEVRRNVLSLAMVEGAILSSDRKQGVVLADLLEASLESAIEGEPSDDVAAELRSWSSAAAGITTPAWGSPMPANR